MAAKHQSLIAICLSAVVHPAAAQTTLKCEINKKCDAFVRTCVDEPYSLTATVDPVRKTVTIGSRRIAADFSNPAEVSFEFTRYTVRLNRYEYSAILTAEGEIRYGWCSRTQPAW